MARIRTIKPEFPKDEIVGAMTRDVRLLFLLLLTLADDEGRFRASAALIRAELFPYDEDLSQATVSDWLGVLERLGRIRFYVVDEQQYAEIVNFKKHQRVERPSPSKLPARTAENTVSPNRSPNVPRSFTESSVRPHGGIGREGKGREEEGKREPAASPPPVAGHRDLVSAFHDGFLEATGAKPSWGAKEGKQIKALLARQPLDECLRRLRIFFGPDRPGWLTSYDLATFLQHFDKFAIATGPPGRPSRVDPQIDRLLLRTRGTDDRSRSVEVPADPQGRLPENGSG